MLIACSAASLGARTHPPEAWSATASCGGSYADAASVTHGRTLPTVFAMFALPIFLGLIVLVVNVATRL
jgi:hypothetical protein